MYEFLIQSELLHSVITSTNLRHGVGEAEEEEGRCIFEVIEVHTTDPLHHFVVIGRFWCIGRVFLIAERVAVLLRQENLPKSCKNVLLAWNLGIIHSQGRSKVNLPVSSPCDKS